MMQYKIIYTEKGGGLHSAIQAAGFNLVQIDGEWWADSPEAQRFIDEYTAGPLAADLIEKIKVMAGEKINAQYPQWKQLNMLARHAELTSLPERDAGELAEMAALQAAWVWIKQVREASAVHEAALLALARDGDFAALLVYDSAAGWPDWGRMAEILMTAVASGVAAGGVAAAAGLPQQQVLVWAVVGGLVNVWLAAQQVEPVSTAWVFRQLARVGVAAASGIALSAAVRAIAPAYSLTAPLAAVPHEALAGIIAGGIHHVGPRVLDAVLGQLGSARREQ